MANCFVLTPKSFILKNKWRIVLRFSIFFVSLLSTMNLFNRQMAQERYINPYTDFGFKKLFEQAEIAKYNPEERREYEASLKNFWDYYSTIKSALNKGREEGREEGRAEGREEGRAEGREEGLAEGEAKGHVEDARKMKAKGYAAEDIADITGLSIEEIARL